MKGNITTREICFVCKSNLIHDERRNGCFCPEHPQVGATTFIVRFGSDIYRRFKNYQQATQFLTGLRYKTGEGSYDPNDYRKENPNGFRNLSERYLKKKANKKSFSNIRNYIRVAQEHFGDTNVKYINSADIDEFLFDIPLQLKLQNWKAKRLQKNILVTEQTKRLIGTVKWMKKNHLIWHNLLLEGKRGLMYWNSRKGQNKGEYKAAPVPPHYLWGIFSCNLLKL